MQLVNLAIIDFFIWLRSERGQDLLEYAMLGGLLAAAFVVIGGILLATGGANPVQKFATGVGDCIDFDGGTPCGP